MLLHLLPALADRTPAELATGALKKMFLRPSAEARDGWNAKISYGRSGGSNGHTLCTLAGKRARASWRVWSPS